MTDLKTHVDENNDATTEIFSPYCVSVQISIHRKINMKCESRNLFTITLVSCVDDPVHIFIQDTRICIISAKILK